MSKKLDIIGSAIEHSFCDFSRLSGITPPFQLPIAHFDQNRIITGNVNFTPSSLLQHHTYGGVHPIFWGQNYCWV